VAPVPAAIQPPSPIPTTATKPPAAAPATGALAPAEVEAFLINFVMEQTGYPQEIVELDADLEADLGIDSIKKAQLFGELGEYFDVQASSDLSLDAFPTLRTVMEFLLQNAAAHAPIAPSVEVPATSPPSPSSVSPPAAFDPSEVEAFIINLVMDRTGYPREVVDLDGDLEADLGIDDIKKAELLAHLGAHFGVPGLADLPASEFPTLRKAMEYVVRNRPANQYPNQPR
jgi:acyl carrier protein